MRYILVSFSVQKEGDQFVSTCPELGTASCGSTQDEALRNVVDATQLYLDTLEELGECSKVLRERGVSVHAKPASGEMVSAPQARVYAGVFPLQSACA
ncbi:MAG: hypothetical protein BWY10_02120 [Chloroflexi bacterium ADurb.Bin180]|nr:MAG: hypothetical protein BWY10_02120 [Chloroflexi bacterium ADurb.Bin180]